MNEILSGPGAIQEKLSKEGLDLLTKLQSALDCPDENSLIVDILVHGLRSNRELIQSLSKDVIDLHEKFDKLALDYEKDLTRDYKRIKELEEKIVFLGKGAVLDANELHEVKNNNFESHAHLESRINHALESHEKFMEDTKLMLLGHGNMIADLGIKSKEFEPTLKLFEHRVNELEDVSYKHLPKVHADMDKRFLQLKREFNEHIQASSSVHGEPNRDLPKKQSPEE